MDFSINNATVFEWSASPPAVATSMDGFTNVVTHVDYILTATRGGQGTAMPIAVDLPPPDANTFVAFNSLTLDIVSGWVTDVYGSDFVNGWMQSLDCQLDKLIAANSAVIMAAPWAN
ncbi:MAG TPA: hypothetical protein VHY32_02745 [Caulobacteraceae bacterium]|jgi:hypothetical protein|nr:hypothetical protein [Caulobacteraceae bacterium]